MKYRDLSRVNGVENHVASTRENRLSLRYLQLSPEIVAVYYTLADIVYYRLMSDVVAYIYTEKQVAKVC